MQRIFLDANILFSAAWREASGLLKLWDAESFHLVTHAYAVEEVRRNLNHKDQLHRLDKLLKNIEVVMDDIDIVSLRIHLPEKDVPIMCAAIQAQSDILVTGDFRHFGKYYNKVVHGVRILPPAELFRGKGEQPD